MKHLYYLYGNPNGCGYYRLIWPFQYLESCRQAGICTNRWILDPSFLSSVEAVRIQCLVSPQQVAVFKALVEARQRFGFKIIYELDDMPFREHIPDYNIGKKAYDSDEVRGLLGKFMNSCDEITCTCTYFRDLLKTKITNDKITVIPNLQPKNWIKPHYRKDFAEDIYSKTKKRPRVLYAGAFNHFAMENNIPDDFTHVNDLVAQTVDEFEWHFLGGIPRALIGLAKENKIVYHEFTPVNNLGWSISEIAPTVYIAPLIDNEFNRCKSNIKLIESGMLGIPFIGQDMETYKETPYRFKTANDLYKMIKGITQSRSNFMAASRFGLDISSKYILETDDNLKMFNELHTTPYGSPERTKLNVWQKELTKADLWVP